VYHTASRCKALQHFAICWHTFAINTLQYPATPCNTLQHPATHCNTLQHCTTLHGTASHYNTLQHTEHTFHFRAQHTATPCNIRQHPATHWNTLQHTATYQGLLAHFCAKLYEACNTLQHTATCDTATLCNALQDLLAHFRAQLTATHIATICNTASHCATLHQDRTCSHTFAPNPMKLNPNIKMPMHLRARTG